MTDQQLGPFDANGMLISPYGTRVSEAQQEARRRRHAERIAAAVAEREATEAQLRADQEQQRKEAGQKRLEAYRKQCLVKWTDNGGTETGFASAWPSLRDTWLADKLGDRVAEEVARLRTQPLYQL